MTERVRNPGMPTLLDSVYANWIEFYTQLGRAPGVELSVGRHLSWMLTGIPDAFLNVVFRTDVPSDGATRVVEEALAYFAASRITHLSWLRPGASVARLLERRGFAVDELGTAMAADLDDVPDHVSAPIGLDIHRVGDRTELEPWVEVMCSSFGIPQDLAGRVLDVFASVSMTPQMHTYLATLRGRPVATSQLFLAAGVAGVYNVTSLADVRGRGIGAAVTLASLLDARRLGYRSSVLQASDLGQPVYRRLGFRDYGRLDRYVLGPAAQADSARQSRRS